MITETTISDEDETDADPAGFHLLVMSPEYFASHSLPASGTVTIGRSSKCGVRIEDPMASREHARIRVSGVGGTPIISIEDLGSANGTRVRESSMRGTNAAIAPGEGVIIGATVVMVVQNNSPSGLRRLWSHAYFGARLDDECIRATHQKGPLALARIRFAKSAPRVKVLPILARDLASSQGVAIYAPNDYEILFTNEQVEDASGVVERLVAAFRAEGLEARTALAWFPKDGQTGDALLATANATLRTGQAGRPEAVALVPAVPPSSAGMKRVLDMAARVAGSQINVMIRGETGVGKDVLARMIHEMSPRADKPFLALNCAGLPESLLESELFGHAKGTFTGATSSKTGLLETADGGTVLLDEIGDMPLSIQVKLLRVIENHEIRPLGGLRAKTVNVRFLAATNKDLDEAIAKAEFRQDLMFRLNGISLNIPPLRERRDEIPVLAQLFIAEGFKDAGQDTPPTLSTEAMSSLLEHDWKGNIRELKNVVDRAILLCDGGVILPVHLELRSGTGSPSPQTGSGLPVLSDPQEIAERKRILEALYACASNQTRAAQMLKMARRTLVSRLDYYEIPRPQKGTSPFEVPRAIIEPSRDPDGGDEDRK